MGTKADGKATNYWTTNAIERARATVRTILAAKCAAMSRDERLRHVVAQVMLMNESPSPLDQLIRFNYLLEALEVQSVAGGLERRHVNQLFEIGKEILARHGVLKPKSRLAFLHAELLMLMSRIDAANGDAWRAMVHSKHAVSLTGSAPDARFAAARLGHARWLVRQGHAPMALALIANLEESVASDQLPPDLILVKASALRLTGRVKEALAALSSTRSREAEWEIAKMELCSPGSFKDLARDARQGGRFYWMGALLELALYSRCHEPATTRNFVPEISNLSRRRHLDWNEDHQRTLVGFLRLLDTAYRPGVDTDRMTEQLVHACRDLPALMTLEQEMLVTFAIGRWLSRVNALDLAATFLRDYRAKSLASSDATTSDALGIGQDLLARPWMQGSHPVTDVDKAS